MFLNNIQGVPQVNCTNHSQNLEFIVIAQYNWSMRLSA